MQCYDFRKLPHFLHFSIIELMEEELSSVTREEQFIDVQLISIE